MPLAYDTTTSTQVPGNKIGRTRTVLARRLADIVCLPSSRITPMERHMAGDLLVGILAQSPLELRQHCVRRLLPLIDVATDLLRFLAQDDIEVARIVLEESKALSDAQLAEVARLTTRSHRLAISRRKELSELVCEILLAPEELDVAAQLLKNQGAHLSQNTMEQMVKLSRGDAPLCPLLLKRAELRPAQAFTIFWWTGPKERARILTRFAVGREIMQDAVADIFVLMDEEDWQDPLVRKAMQFIERRHRNRSAIDKSPYSNLENAIDTALEIGIDATLAEELSYLSGIKPVTGAQILSDKGGEPLAIFCKATGLKRDYFIKLWQALKRPIGAPESPEPHLVAAKKCFDTLSSNKAQTVLRYWNWALSSELSANRMAQIQAPGGLEIDQAMSTPERTAALVYGRWNKG